MESRNYFLLFNLIEGLGPRRLNKLLEFLGGPEQVWEANERDLKKVPSIPPRVIENIINKRKILNPESEIQKLKAAGINFLFLGEPGYPEALSQIYDPPRVLYFRGNPEAMSRPMLGIVGARKATHYGLTVAETVAHDLAMAGLCIVSGLARGIDSAAHKGAIRASGATAAVLGCGVDVVYPRENRKLMEDIIKTGVVVSEFPPGLPPVPANFPQRNRVISGLSRGIIIVEAAEKSGSLITADFALEQGREVFAVPGQVTNPLSRGAHKLIKQGARLVEDASDVLEELGVEAVSMRQSRQIKDKDLTSVEKKIYNIVSDAPVDSDTIIERTQIRSSEVLAALLNMELKGLIVQLPGQLYVRCGG